MNIAASYAQKGLEIAGEWVANQIAMALASEAIAEEEAATKTATAIAAAAEAKAIAAAEIPAAAGTGAAWAMASVAAIPYVGWAMAPAVGAEHFTVAMGFMAPAMASAAGGWWEVPQDQVAMIHKREMVMPAHLAERVRNMAEGGGEGGGRQPIVLNYRPNVQALDSRGVKGVLRDHARFLVDLMAEQKSNFNGGGKR